MKSKKIAVVNRTNLKNFGSVLQVYALCHVLKKIGYESEVVWESGNISKHWDIRPKKILKIGLKLAFNPRLLWSTYKTVREIKANIVDECKAIKFDDFVSNHFEQTFYGPKELINIAHSNKYAKFICGSDQIWCSTTLYVDPMMYLRFAPKEKRVAYAPSLGRDYIPKYNKSTISNFVNDIPSVSVREDDGQRLLKELTGRDIAVVADPTLLMRDVEWKELMEPIETPESYALCYFLDEPSDAIKAEIYNYVQKTRKKVVVLGKLSLTGLSEADVQYPVAGPGEFLTLTGNANMVITDSYHGMLFAINFHKNFWAVERNYNQFDQSSRQRTVLIRLGLENRYQKSNYCFTDDSIDYEQVLSKIDEFVIYSMNYLITSLEK